jgi:aminoglycoside 6'-N-acetyltransferase
MMPRCSYQFRPVGAADLPLLQQWLERPHVREWWGGPVRGLSNIDEHLPDPAIDLFIVSHDHEPDFIDRGPGNAFIRACLERVFEAGAPRGVTDPDRRNARAIRAYPKAGFHPIGPRATLPGDALLMSCDARTVNP